MKRRLKRENLVQVSPQAVKRMFKTSRKSYYENKKAAVRKLYELIDVRGKQLLEGFSKMDDVDAMVWYFRRLRFPAGLGVRGLGAFRLRGNGREGPAVCV